MTLSNHPTPNQFHQYSFITPRLTDFSVSPGHDDGLAWFPFVLIPPGTDKITLGDLLAGFQTQEQTLTPPPKEGECVLLYSENKVSNKFSKDGKMVHFQAEPREGIQGLAKEIVVVSEAKTLQLVALVKLSEKAEAQCMLPAKQLRISWGYGNDRKDIIWKPQTNVSSTINLESHGQATLIIRPSKENNIENGDVIRIGRTFAKAKKYFDDRTSIIPQRIPNDIFQDSGFLSKDMDVSQVLYSSILVGSHSFRLSIVPQEYVVAVMRHNHLECLKKIDLSGFTTQELNCKGGESEDKESRILNKNQFSFLFDMTFYPSYLSENISFKNWVMAKKNIFMPIPLEHWQENTQEGAFSFLYLNDKLRVQRYPSIFNFDTNSASILGTTFDGISKGMPPFSKMTIIRFDVPVENHLLLKIPYVLSTNGVDIKFLEPFLTPQGFFPVKSKQRVRVRLSIPRWNSTSVLDAYINKRLVKRWVINRGDISEPYSATLETNLSFNQKQYLTLVAWGQTPLPDLLFGVKNFFPYAQTRDYFVMFNSSLRMLILDKNYRMNVSLIKTYSHNLVKEDYAALQEILKNPRPAFLAPLIDATILAPQTSEASIVDFCHEAVQMNVRAICIPPCHVPIAIQTLSEGSCVLVCTVVGFPLGYVDTAVKVKETLLAVEQGAQEIDFVQNISWVKDQKWAFLEKEYREIVQAAQGALVKIIMETSLLSSDELTQCTLLAARCGVHTIKTSTGFGARGASLDDILIISEALDTHEKEFGVRLGIKASGGIREDIQALSLVKAGVTRIGTSRFKEILRGK